MLKTWIIYTIMLVGAAFLNRLKPGFVSSLGVYAVISVPIVSFIHLFFTFTRFRVNHDVDRRHVPKGDKIVYQFIIQNPSRILFAPFKVEYISNKRLFKDSDLKMDEEIIVQGREEVHMKTNLVCNYRGNYAVGVEKIFIRDYLNFFKMTYRSIEQHKVLIYPKLRELQSGILRNVVNESNESITAQDIHSNSVFSDIREYQPGDSLKSIHWKLSAKKGDILTKVFSGQMTNKTKVFLNTYNLDLGREDAIVYEDYMVEGAVSLLHFLLENRVSTSLYFKDRKYFVYEGHSSGDFAKFYNAMANLSFHNQKGQFLPMMKRVLENERDPYHVVIMSQVVNVELAEFLVKLKYRNYEVSLIVIDSQILEIDAISSYHDNQSMFMLNSSGIPVFHLQHDGNNTRLEVS